MNKRDFQGINTNRNEQYNYQQAEDFSPFYSSSTTNNIGDSPSTSDNSPSSTANISSILKDSSASSIINRTNSFSPERKHRRNTSTTSAFSVSTLGLNTPTARTPRTPHSAQDYIDIGSVPNHLFADHQGLPQRSNTNSDRNRFASVDYSSNVELSPFPFYNSPERRHNRNQSYLSTASYDSLFPNPAIKSPVRSSINRRAAKEKNVSFQEYPPTLSASSRPYKYERRHVEDRNRDRDFLRGRESSASRHRSTLKELVRESPFRDWHRERRGREIEHPLLDPRSRRKHRHLYHRSAPPQPQFLPSPKESLSRPSNTTTRSFPYRMMQQEPNNHPSSAKERVSNSNPPPPPSTHVIASDTTGSVEVMLKETDSNKGRPYSQIVSEENSKKKSGGSSSGAEAAETTKNDTPPREKTSFERGKKGIVSPPEGQNLGHNRSSSYNTVDFHADLPSVPDSPYSPYRQHHPAYSGYVAPPHQHGHHPFAPTSPVKASMKSPARPGDDRQAPYSFVPPYGYHYPPPGYEDNYRDVSPGKRQRVSVPESGADHNSVKDPYQQRAFYNRTSGNRDFYSDSFDSDQQSERSKHGLAPPVSKAFSYPPPPSPGRYEGVDSSANSYPGSRRAHPTGHGVGNDSSYGQLAHHRGHAPPGPHGYEYHEPGYYADPHSPTRYHDMSGTPGRVHGGYYYQDGAPPHEEVHPLLREYDQDRDRRSGAAAGDDSSRTEKQLSSPGRVSVKADNESVATTPSLKSRSSNKPSSPNKTKPSSAAKAAIAAGMTQPASAQEVDFDIHNPPLEPVIPPGTEPACSISSNVNNHDVLCGRGGGTNTQIGNRRFRALVQEFQPTYLLCRRKEKPLIARTIVLIVRNRGGRFLKKDDGNGMLFEVGDSKAEAKTSQALREGLDVRASKSTTIMGRKKQRADKKKKQQEETSSQSSPKKEQMTQGDDLTISESPARSQRDGPPPQHEYQPYPPPPPHYFYGGYGNQYPPYYGYESNPAFGSPSRKRQRPPQQDNMYYPPPPYNYKSYQSYPYPPEYHYQGYAPPPPQQNQSGEESAMWEMDFNPPRGSTKKEDVRVKGEQ